MKVKLLLVAAAALVMASCGTAEEIAELEVPDDSPIEMHTDPLYIEITNFEGRRINSTLSFIEIEDGHLTAKIPTVLGLYDDIMFSNEFALSFDNVSASIGEPRAYKKGKGYSFSMTADGAYFFGERSLAFWRFYFDVQGRKRVRITIESDTLTETGTYNIWHLDGKILKEKSKGGRVNYTTSGADIEFKY